MLTFVLLMAILVSNLAPLIKLSMQFASTVSVVEQHGKVPLRKQSYGLPDTSHYAVFKEGILEVLQNYMDYMEQ